MQVLCTPVAAGGFAPQAVERCVYVEAHPNAISAPGFARRALFAMSQSQDVDINEILPRSMAQEL